MNKQIDEFIQEFDDKLNDKFLKSEKIFDAWDLISPVKSAGGKVFQVRWITKYFPSHVMFIEVFCGSSALLFYKKPSKLEVMNDLDDLITNFFKQLRENPFELFKRLYFIPYSRKDFQEINERFSNSQFIDEIDKAVCFFYLNRTSYAGKVFKPYFDSKMKDYHESRTEGKLRMKIGFNKSLTYYNRVNQIFKFQKRIQNVIIENDDYKKIIKKYDTPNTLFYCDPPYFNIKFYRYNFDEKDHNELAEILKNIEGKFILSYNYDEKLENLYPKDQFIWKFKEFFSTMPKEKRTKRIEILIMNFDIKKEKKFNPNSTIDRFIGKLK